MTPPSFLSSLTGLFARPAAEAVAKYGVKRLVAVTSLGHGYRGEAVALGVQTDAHNCSLYALFGAMSLWVTMPPPSSPLLRTLTPDEARAWRTLLRYLGRDDTVGTG